MTALGIGWKLIVLGSTTLLLAAVIGALTSRTNSPRLKPLRRVCAGLAIVSAITLIVVVIIGPGPWCGPGDAYKVPGCA